MSKELVIVTGGAGYIGSHTIIELLDNGFDVVSLDNFSRSTRETFDYIESITGKRVMNYEVDLCKPADLDTIFDRLQHAIGLIHFAAFKSVPESVANPELYYYNNLTSLVNVLNSSKKYNINNIVFSSSCSVYGDIKELPVSEQTVLSEPKSSYAATKIIGEKIVGDVCRAHKLNAMCLRYFNPVGAHPSGLIGENPLNKPDNLVPVITQTANGKRPLMEVFGGNLDTRDGSCIRDYVHVMDIANAHVLALQYLKYKKNVFEIINLGTGSGVSVFEAIKTFEKVSGTKLNYKVAEPREGDVIEIYSNVEKAKQVLGWQARYDINDMMSSAWKWEVHISGIKEKVNQ